MPRTCASLLCEYLNEKSNRKHDKQSRWCSRDAGYFICTKQGPLSLSRVNEMLTVMMMPRPVSSNCGRPARPNICCTSSMPGKVTKLQPRYSESVRGYCIWISLCCMKNHDGCRLHRRRCIAATENMQHAQGARERAPRSLNWPLWASYSCVPLMMTVCAGRFTPHASVAVVHSTCRAKPLLLSVFVS